MSSFPGKVLGQNPKTTVATYEQQLAADPEWA